MQTLATALSYTLLIGNFAELILVVASDCHGTAMSSPEKTKRSRSVSSSEEEGAVRKRFKDDQDSESSPVLERPRAPRHPSQMGGNSPNTNTPLSPFNVVDTPETVNSPPERRSDRVFSGCSSFDDYSIIKKIGEGTFGEVTRAKHKRSGKTFALKKILMHDEKEGMPITALREIKILKSLNHPNIVSLTEIAFQKGDRKTRSRGSIYMVFPYMDHDLSGLKAFKLRSFGK